MPAATASTAAWWPAPNAARPRPTPIAAAHQYAAATSYRKVDRDDITGAIPSDASGGCRGGTLRQSGGDRLHALKRGLNMAFTRRPALGRAFCFAREALRNENAAPGVGAVSGTGPVMKIVLLNLFGTLLVVMVDRRACCRAGLAALRAWPSQRNFPPHQ